MMLFLHKMLFKFIKVCCPMHLFYKPQNKIFLYFYHRCLFMEHFWIYVKVFPWHNFSITLITPQSFNFGFLDTDNDHFLLRIQWRLIFAIVILCSRLRLWVNYFIYFKFTFVFFQWMFFSSINEIYRLRKKIPYLLEWAPGGLI